ncbi:MAG: hypothetical protein MUF49_20205 [Oculatellaceae cyanobacterium Prado106]|jgi:hypothetical protein|nr:hypothetical protein [Oculatellaceae cyanobacterium Prado106]
MERQWGKGWIAIGWVFGIGLNTHLLWLGFNHFLFQPILAAEWNTTERITCLQKPKTAIDCIYHRDALLWQPPATQTFKLYGVKVVPEQVPLDDGGYITEYLLHLETDSGVFQIEAYRSLPDKAKQIKAEFETFLEREGGTRLDLPYGVGFWRTLLLIAVFILYLITLLVAMLILLMVSPNSSLQSLSSSDQESDRS